MNWFAGSIAEAISLCQAEKLVFLVYVHDSEAHSAETNAYWEDAAVADRCSASCVSIRLQADSDECNQFRQICIKNTRFP